MSALLLAIIFIAFISLGLPDSLLGSAWPTVYQDLNLPVSSAGLIMVIVSIGTVLSSFFSDKVLRKISTLQMTVISVLLTTVALFGYSFSNNLFWFCFWSIPYGLGAGGVDTALNNYVALHYKSRHMSWLHSFWGVGATAGPIVMGFVLSRGFSWPFGYQIIGYIQLFVALIILISKPLWLKDSSLSVQNNQQIILSNKEKLGLPGVKSLLIASFCYFTVETATGLWAASYLVLARGIDENTAATWVSFFYLGITIFRFVGGLVTDKIGDKKMILNGIWLIAIGCFLLIIPNNTVMLISLVLIGCGCAPVYPCLIHQIPSLFGANKSQAVISVQFSFAYLACAITPPIFGAIAQYVNIAFLPYFVLVFNVLMFVCVKLLYKNSKKPKLKG